MEPDLAVMVSQLDELPGLFELLKIEVLEKSFVIRGSGGFGSNTPIQGAVFDFLWFSNHEGCPGMVQSLTSSEVITRLAFSHAVPETLTVSGAIGYLRQRLESIMKGGYWSLAAREAVLSVGAGILKRISPEHVRLEFDLRQREARRQLQEAGLDPDLREALQMDLAEPYHQFATRWHDSITRRYQRASDSAESWSYYLKDEIARLHRTSERLLGMTAHSTQGLAICPWCGHGQLGLTQDDPDLACCSHCRRSWRLSTGEATQHFSIWRQAGWTPQKSQ